MPYVEYTNDDGYRKIVLVKEGTLPVHYDRGIEIGPPALDDLDVSESDKVRISNALFDSGFITYPDLSGMRHRLVVILRKLQLVDNDDDLRFLRNSVLAIYQRSHYPEQFLTETDND